MPRLACWSCGRSLDTATPFESLPPDERRCPRCGATLGPERRADERRQADRRRNSQHDPGPPAGLGERRVEDRRRLTRRRPSNAAGGGTPGAS